MRNWCAALALSAFFALPLSAQQKIGGAGDETTNTAAAAEKSPASGNAAETNKPVATNGPFALPATPRPTSFPGPATASADTRAPGTLVPRYVGDLPSNLQCPTTERTPEKDEILPLEELERRAILRTLRETGGDKLSAARISASARPLSTVSSSNTTWSTPNSRAEEQGREVLSSSFQQPARYFCRIYRRDSGGTRLFAR